MSNEEKKAIDFTKYLVNDYKKQLELIGKENKNYGYSDEEIDVIKYRNEQFEILLNLIEKQQKEIDELQSYIKEYLIPKSTINLLYVSKDKIRAKIKELDEKWHVLYRDSEVKDILEKLLEEE